MHSLRTRLTLLTIVIVVISVSLIGVICLYRVKRTTDESSTQLMNELCLDKAGELNSFLDEIRLDLEIATSYLYDEVSVSALVEGGVVGALGTGDSLGERDYSSDKQKSLDRHLHLLLEKARELFRSVAYNSSSAATYFFRINPELSRSEQGFLFIRQGYSDFQETAPTDIMAYDPQDISHVGWYYQALDGGRPRWLVPYQDDNLGLIVTTYVVPMFKGGTFLGVAGMDISYEQLVDKIQDLGIYDSGYAFLTDQYGKIVYHPTLKRGVMLQEVNQELRSAGNDLYHNEASTSLITYRMNGVTRKAAWQTLSDGLRLFVSAPASEIDAGWLNLMSRIIVAGIALCLVFASVVTVVMRFVTEPLKRLTLASEEIAHGNYDTELPYEGKDEVGILTKSFRHLTEHLKSYIGDLNSRAYKDALTNVRNKGAFDIYTEQMNAGANGAERYAIVMFDCNNLKQINDSYGHSSGDSYLKASCAVICKGFPHSPVFRIGGDEFAVILENEAYDRRSELTEALFLRIEAANAAAQHPWEKVSLAMGLAEYDPASDRDASDVLKRADAMMYSDKTRWKEQEAASKADGTRPGAPD